MKEQFRRAINYSGLPEHMRYPVQQYIERGLVPGSFVAAVICNDLTSAVNNADTLTRPHLVEIVKWFMAEAPAACWHGPGPYANWVQCGGLRGWRQTSSGKVDVS